jgi:hypothetical protein
MCDIEIRRTGEIHRFGKPLKKVRWLNARTWTYTYHHKPTGIEVTRTIESDFYTKRQMREKKDKLHEEMINELKARLMEYYRIPGRIRRI